MTSSTTSTSTTHSANTVLLWIGLFGLCILVRVLVGYQPHSGQDNYHGQYNTYGGDFECQRHWMEITFNIPISYWYWYDLYYWGLDYPPLSAYVSYLFGGISYYIIGIQSIELNTSRGYENPIHKSYMRFTVILLDMLLYGTAAWSYTTTSSLVQTTRQQQQQHQQQSSVTTSTTTNATITAALSFLFVMIQPSILLIDHGHFQYNTTSLGLSLWGLFYMTIPTSTNTVLFTPCIIGSIYFCCALNFKQMTLYYAPVVFFYLLGRCFQQQNPSFFDPTIIPQESTNTGVSNNKNNNSNNSNNTQQMVTMTASREQNETTTISITTFLVRFLSLGITVILCFTIMWWPFIVYGPIVVPSYIERALHVFRRIIPLQRGLFEGKVSNIWYVLSIKPFRIRNRIPEKIQPLLALGLTCIMSFPACYRLFHVGKQRILIIQNHNQNQQQQQQNDYSTSRSIENYNMNTQLGINWIETRTVLLWGSASTALAFFLASFQVHEKSLLMAVAPISLLWTIDPLFCEWFSIVSTWTLWPLLQLDRLQTAYYCTILIFISFLQICKQCGFGIGPIDDPTLFYDEKKNTTTGFFESNGNIVNRIPTLSYWIMVVMHIVEWIIVPPKELPDLFVVVRCIIGCGFCCLAWLITCWHLLVPVQPQRLHATNNMEKNYIDNQSTSSSSQIKEKIS